jgi:alpha,alpha-trehalase
MTVAPDAAIFDTDGVVTRTAEVHERAWRRVLDEATVHHGVLGAPFEHSDYLRHLDGRSRYDGVAAFLSSRSIDLPWGSPEDPPAMDTVCGIGNMKNVRFREAISVEGVEPYESTLAFIRRLRDEGVGVAVISASRNCAEVLAAAGASDLFDARVDGLVAAELQLPGKPDPAVFLEAARRLGVTPGRSAVVEDSLAGVAAGRRGGFGLVVGVNRTGVADELERAGADVVVADMSQLRVDERRRWVGMDQNR